MLLVCMPKRVHPFQYATDIFDSLVVSEKTHSEIELFMSDTPYNAAIGHLCIASSIDHHTKWDSAKYVLPFVYKNTLPRDWMCNNVPLASKKWQGYASNQICIYRYMAAIHCCTVHWNKVVALLKQPFAKTEKQPSKHTIERTLLEAVRYHRYALCMLNTHADAIANYGYPIFGQKKDVYMFELVRCLYLYHTREHPISTFTEPTEACLRDTLLLIIHILKCISEMDADNTWTASTKQWFQIEFFCIYVLFMHMYTKMPYAINQDPTQLPIQCLAEIEQLLPCFTDRYPQKAAIVEKEYKNNRSIFARELLSYKSKSPAYLDATQLALIVSKTDTSAMQLIKESNDISTVAALIESHFVTKKLHDEKE